MHHCTLMLHFDFDVSLCRQSVTHLTPLMVAAIEGHAVIFSMLLEYVSCYLIPFTMIYQSVVCINLSFYHDISVCNLYQFELLP